MARIEAWMYNVELNDLPEAYRTLAAIIGVESTLKLLEERAGTYVYVPKTDALIRSFRDRDILKRYHQGLTANQLAQRYSLSVVNIYDIINREEAKRRAQRDQNKSE